MGLVRTLSRKILYGCMGWKIDIRAAHPHKFILCLAPHTSNMDFIIGLLYSRAEGMRANFLMKKEWFVWPLGVWFRHLGGIPVNRGKHTSMTDALAEAAWQHPEFRLCVTPEGTRSLNPDWKKGFYFIALKAGLPILLYALDFERKMIVCEKTIVPSGDVDKDMRVIRAYYKDFKGRHPEKFSVGEL